MNKILIAAAISIFILILKESELLATPSPCVEPEGSWKKSCENPELAYDEKESECKLTASCKDRHGNLNETSYTWKVKRVDLKNSDGVLESKKHEHKPK